MCLSRAVLGGDPDESTWQEFWDAFIDMSMDGGGESDGYRPGQVLFFLGRHVMELTLKGCCTSPPRTHRLGDLLRRVDPSHTLHSAGDEARAVRAFVLEVDGLDPKGDEGRYGRTSGGTASLAEACCMDPVLFVRSVQGLVFLAGYRPSRWLD